MKIKLLITLLCAVIGLKAQAITNQVVVTNITTVKLVWTDPNPDGLVTNFVVIAYFPDKSSRTWVGPRSGVTNSLPLAKAFGLSSITSGSYQFFVSAIDTNNIQSDPAEWKGFLALPPQKVVNLQILAQ